MLAKLEQARSLLAQVCDATEAKEVVDMAHAFEVYARRQHVSKDIIDMATALKIDAITLLAEIWAGSPKNIGTAGRIVGPGRGNKTVGVVRYSPFPQPPTLKELGIGKKEIVEGQFLARLKREDRKMYEDVRNGVMSVGQARREAKIKKIRRKLEKNAARKPKAAVGEFDVIIMDPPWQAMDEVKLGYSTMTLAQIEQENLVKKYAAKDCHVFLWTTNTFLPAAFDLFEKWGVKYSCTFVWHKDRGMQPTGSPQYTCEFCLYGKVGSPEFVECKDFQTCFSADHTGHSEKPEKFYETIRRVTAGRRLDAYNRRKIEGFIGWGKEAPAQ